MGPAAGSRAHFRCCREQKRPNLAIGPQTNTMLRWELEVHVETGLENVGVVAVSYPAV